MGCVWFGLGLFRLGWVDSGLVWLVCVGFGFGFDLFGFGLVRFGFGFVLVGFGLGMFGLELGLVDSDLVWWVWVWFGLVG